MPEILTDTVGQLSDKSQFVLQVTHELRGPIAAVLGYHEMILKGICGEVSPEVRRNLEKADTRAKKLLDIVDEMLDFARMSSNDVAPNHQSEVNVRSLIQENIDPIIKNINGNGTEIHNDAPDGISLQSNRDLLNMVLTNLIANAVKYSPGGGTVNVAAVMKNNHVSIQIADQGMGIEKEEIVNIFDEFYRSRRARILDDNGTGLGLPIVCKALTFLGGHVCVKSRPDQGALFTVCLPLTHTSFGCPCSTDGKHCAAFH